MITARSLAGEEASHGSAFCLVLAGRAIALLKRILGSPFGAVLSGIRENSDRAGARGYDIGRVTLPSFAFFSAVVLFLPAASGGHSSEDSMAVKVLELHHHGIRVGPSAPEVKKALEFYHDVLGLEPDAGRPTIPTIDGYWMDVGGKAQIHLMGVEGQSKFAEGPGKDPSHPHVALAVPDIQEAKAELERLGASFWVTRGVVGPESQQIFMHDPFGNMIELHQVGTCRCDSGRRPAATKSTMR